MKKVKTFILLVSKYSDNNTKPTIEKKDTG